MSEPVATHEANLHRDNAAELVMRLFFHRIPRAVLTLWRWTMRRGRA